MSEAVARQVRKTPGRARAEHGRPARADVCTDAPARLELLTLASRLGEICADPTFVVALEKIADQFASLHREDRAPRLNAEGRKLVNKIYLKSAALVEILEAIDHELSIMQMMGEQRGINAAHLVEQVISECVRLQDLMDFTVRMSESAACNVLMAPRFAAEQVIAEFRRRGLAVSDYDQGLAARCLETIFETVGYPASGRQWIRTVLAEAGK